ncbi:MAG TPA: APC family permease [Gammaproteobacteria bacterium]|jgi:amino acid transporter|nr:APC family permease [Gammaproteobacteria bacterium]
MAKSGRRISPATLFMLSMNGIIGSGWLFAPLYAAKIAGPAAIFSWVIGGMAALLIAFTFAELSTMLPISGGSAHIPQLSHGVFASFIMSWIAWITSLILAPIEVQAVLQYAALFFPALMSYVDGTPMLTLWGYLWAAILMIGLCLVNIFSYRGLMQFNFVLFVFKIAVIVLTIFTIFHVQFNPSNFDGLVSSTMSSHGWQTILSAVATGGIVLAFNGFRSGVELAGETNRLALAIPLSTVGCVLTCMLLYIGLQICFIGALDPAILTGGWQNLNYTGDIGPFVGLASALGLFWLLKLLYVNSVVSPLGAGLIYVTSTARILYAMSRIGYMPKFLSLLNHQRFPMWAIVVNFLLGMLSFLPLPGWQAMVNFLVSAIIITYAIGPIALLSLRLSLPEETRPFRLPAAAFLCPFAFYCCNLFSYWTGWETISKLAIILCFGLAIFALAYWRGKIKIKTHEMKAAGWIVPYLIGLVIISYLGSFGGQQIIPFGWDFLVIALFSMVIFYIAMQTRSAISSQSVSNFLNEESLALEGG